MTVNQNSNKTVFMRIRNRIGQLLQHDHLILSLLALGIGCATGVAVIVFRELITLIQSLSYQSDTERFFLYAQNLPWWQLLLVPTVAGLIVGLLTHYLMPDRRPQGIAEVIEASALHGGRMSSKIGWLAALSSAISIGGGASLGREAPAIYLGASLSGWVTRKLHLSPELARTLLGCGSAAAVAASFNAPIAGALFASEVIIGHYALKAFAPVVIASVAGTAISRQYFGDFPAFQIIENSIVSFWEFPAFIGLGLVCGITAMVFIRSVVESRKIADKTPVPGWLKPALAGLLLGAIATQIPEVMGVGYGVTEAALLTRISLAMLIVIAIAKIFTTALCLGWGFSGGIFSPSLLVGALVGSVYGIIATSVFPDLSSGEGVYAIVGMGAVAASVFGAPISTTLIIFEMTSNYALTLAVMLAVVAASEITQQFYCRSLFHLQLGLRGVDLNSGFEAEITRVLKIDPILISYPDTVTVIDGTPFEDAYRCLGKCREGKLFVVDKDQNLTGQITHASVANREGESVCIDPCTDFLVVGDTIETALHLFQESGSDIMAVVEDQHSQRLVGCLTYRDLLNSYNRALVAAHHGKM